MKLTDLEPRWFALEDVGPRVGLTFLCPHCQTQRIGVSFHHRGREAIEDDYIHARSPSTDHIWTMEGNGFEDLTLSPSVDASKSGHWHGSVRNGNIEMGPVVEKFTDNRAATFAWMVPHLTTVARQFGYAIGLHGSMSRDLDLIAVPWTEEASAAEVLVEAIRDAVNGNIRNDPQHRGNKYDLTTRNPSDKPHGRKAWCIYFSGHRFYIDLSVMPLIPRTE